MHSHWRRYCVSLEIDTKRFSNPNEIKHNLTQNLNIRHVFLKTIAVHIAVKALFGQQNVQMCTLCLCVRLCVCVV